MAIKLHSSFAVYPGLWLREEVVDTADINVNELAERLHVTRQSASSSINGHAGV